MTAVVPPLLSTREACLLREEFIRVSWRRRASQVEGREHDLEVEQE